MMDSCCVWTLWSSSINSRGGGNAYSSPGGYTGWANASTPREGGSCSFAGRTTASEGCDWKRGCNEVHTPAQRRRSEPQNEMSFQAKAGSQSQRCLLWFRCILSRANQHCRFLMCSSLTSVQASRLCRSRFSLPIVTMTHGLLSVHQNTVQVILSNVI